jgi:hypothetical protein
MEVKKYAHRVLVWKPDESRPLERPRCRLQTTKIDLKETGWDGIGHECTNVYKI